MRRFAVSVIVALGLTVSAAPPPAGASWGASATGAATASSATIAPATNAVATCNLLLNASVTVTWTPSSSGWADGHEVRWGTTPGGPYPSTSGVVGGSSYSTPALGAGTYYFVVQAAKGAWRSTPTAQVTKSVVVVVLDLVCV